MQSKTLLAIDPGTSKCGVALVRRDAEGKLTLLYRAIAPPDAISVKMREAAEIEPFSMVVVGQGTSCRPLVTRLREEFPAIGILLVDETDTSIQARERFWEHHPRKGWRRLLPASMQVPPEPIDDFAAFVLAERVLL